MRVKNTALTLIKILIAFSLFTITLIGFGLAFNELTPHRRMITTTKPNPPTKPLAYSTIGAVTALNAQSLKQVPRSQRFTIEFAKLDSMVEAQNLVKKLKKQGLLTYYTPFYVGSRVVYRVRRGLYETHKEAAVAAAEQKLEKVLTEDPLSQGATVIVLADGENSCTTVTAAAAYQKMTNHIPIHTIGFAVDPTGKADNQLDDLARISGGTYQLASSGRELEIAFQKLQRDLDQVGMLVSSPNHAPKEISITASTDPLSSIEVQLEPRGRDDHLMLIVDDNIDDLGAKMADTRTTKDANGANRSLSHLLGCAPRRWDAFAT